MRFRSSVSKIYVNPEIENINVNLIVDWSHSVDLGNVVDVSKSVYNSET
jgi:hypothetical protein